MSQFKLVALLSMGILMSACGNAPTNTANTPANTANANAAPAAQTLTVVERPQSVKDKMAARGEQDQAKPTLKVTEPKADSTINSSTVKVKLDLSGDLKGYKPMMDETTHTGNHIHVILDNQPYEAYYNLGQEFELRNVADGDHILRVFPSRPWHESYKNNGAFQLVKFTVKNGGGNANKPTTTNAGNTMANANTTAKPTPEGKDFPESHGGAVDPKKPLLTYSRPKGEYKGDDTNAVMIDFWLENAILEGDVPNDAKKGFTDRVAGAPEYRVRYTIDGGEAKFIDKWEPIWITGFVAGKHTIKVELVDKDGNVVDNGGYNSTTREITITK